MSPREVRCPRCNGLFTPDQVRAAAPTAKCSFCGTELLVRLPPPAPPPAPPALPHLPPPMPRGFEVIETPAPPREPLRAPDGGPFRTASEPVQPPPRPGLTIRWNQRYHVTFFVLTTLALAVLSIAWFAAGAYPTAVVGTIAGVWTLWKSVVAAVSHSYVRVESGSLETYRGPLPSTTRIQIDLAGLAQLFAVRESRSWTQSKFVYLVDAKRRDGREQTLVTVDTPDQARWLEYAIERHVGIEDQAVEGELPREAS